MHLMVPKYSPGPTNLSSSITAKKTTKKMLNKNWTISLTFVFAWIGQTDFFQIDLKYIALEWVSLFGMVSV